MGRARARHRRIHLRAGARRIGRRRPKPRGQPEIPRVRALLDLPRVATNGMNGSIFVLLGAGVTAAFVAGLWGRGLIWAAIVLLVLMFAAM